MTASGRSAKAPRLFPARVVGAFAFLASLAVSLGSTPREALAKNRYALPDSLPLSWEALSDAINASITKE